MKFLQSILLIAIISVLFFSCSKDPSASYGTMTGKLVTNVSGECLPVNVHGDYYAKVGFNSDNYIDVQVDVLATGLYNLTTDTVNGLYFSGSGRVGYGGLNTIRLYPGDSVAKAPGLTTLRVYFNDSIVSNPSTCTFDVNVLDPLTNPAVFTLGSTPGNCTGAVISGVYKAGTALTGTEIVIIDANVLGTGGYEVSTTTVNGVTFSATGVFLNTGPQTIRLVGSGVPIASGLFNFPVSASSGNCTFPLGFGASTGGGTAANFTLGGSPGNCTGVTTAGTYITGTALTAANTASVDVNVTSPGTYSMNTNTVNGITFTSTGSFASAGPQKVTLTATGTPTAAGPFNYKITSGANSCSFSVTAEAPAPPATFTLSGAPGACTAAIVGGSYAATSPLTSANKIKIEVNVATAGSYSITTNTVNGMTFASSGEFTTTGLQDVELQGSGTPLLEGTNSFSPGVAGTFCTFDVVVGPAPPVGSGIYNCKIDGVLTSFAQDAHVEIAYNLFGTTETFLTIEGRVSPLGGPSDEFLLSVSKIPGGDIPAGTYDQNTFISSAGTYKVGMNYTIDNPTTFWGVSDNTPLTPNPAFKIIITTLSSTRCIGTFSGTMKKAGGTGTKVITEGVFDVPVR